MLDRSAPKYCQASKKHKRDACKVQWTVGRKNTQKHATL